MKESMAPKPIMDRGMTDCESEKSLQSLIPFRECCLAILFLTGLHLTVSAQSETEMMHGSQFMLDEIVVVGDRAESVLKKSTTASGVLTSSDLSTIPSKNLAEALSYLTGIVFVNQDASGNMPVAIVRGFYGGGEAEYLLLNVDGVPVNDLSSGLINWNLIPIDEIKRIEITRGGGSAMYGDLAIGAVINVITHRNYPDRNLNMSLKGGQFGNKGIRIDQNYRFDNHGIKLGGNLQKNTGYRDHSDFENNNLTGVYNYGLSKANLWVNVDYSRLRRNDAGPLTEDLLKDNRQQSTSLFSNDNHLRDQFDSAVSFVSSDDLNNQFSLRAGFRSYEQKQTRTLQLTSQLGDSQFENQKNQVFWSQLQYRQELGKTKLISGLEIENGSFDSKYYDLDHTTVLSQGKGSRSKLGFYLEGKQSFNDKLGVTLGAHFDMIKNSGTVSNVPKTGLKISQVSPRVGVHYQYFGARFFEGNLFANWSEAFKAPSLDQLYDTRIINFFGQEFNYSNTSLVPQKSINFDVGLYQKFGFPASALSGEVSLAVYSLDIKNEIDFDMATFKYGNIMKSQHGGVEGSFGFYMANRIRVNSTVNIMDVIFNGGEYDGNILKNIPRISYTNRFTCKLNSYVNIVLAQRFFGEVFLDDANSTSLPAYMVFDSKLQFKLNSMKLDLNLYNLTDTFYNSSGYMLFDPFLQENVKFLYPAQGRYIEISIGYTF